MARSYGWNSQLLAGFETIYGVAPTATLYTKMPFVSSNLDSAQGLLESNVLGRGREPTSPFQDIINVDGDIVVPVDVVNIGIWLKALLGVPNSTAVEGSAGVYRHVFTSSELVLPSLGIEVGMPEVPDYPLFTGVRANSLALTFARSGEAQATINLLGQGETAGTATRAIDPLEEIFRVFSQFQGTIKKDGVLLADVTAASVTYTNNLERIETIRNDGKVDGIDLGIAGLTGSITSRYSNTTLMDLARAGLSMDIELAYTIDASNSLVFFIHEVYLPKPKRNITGPGGIESTFDFQGAKNATAGKMLTVTLTNNKATYL